MIKCGCGDPVDPNHGTQCSECIAEALLPARKRNERGYAILRGETVPRLTSRRRPNG